MCLKQNLFFFETAQDDGDLLLINFWDFGDRMVADDDDIFIDFPVCTAYLFLFLLYRDRGATCVDSKPKTLYSISNKCLSLSAKLSAVL